MIEEDKTFSGFEKMTDKQLSKFENIAEISGLLEGAQLSLQDLAEKVMSEMDSFVPEDEQLFIDEDDSDRNNPEAEKDWENQWFQQTKEYLETKLRFKLVSIDDASVSVNSSALVESSISSDDNSSYVTETKTEDTIIEQKFDYYQTPTTPSTECKLCHLPIQTDFFSCFFCKTNMHYECFLMVKVNHDNQCPNCNKSTKAGVCFILCLIFYLYNIFLLQSFSEYLEKKESEPKPTKKSTVTTRIVHLEKKEPEPKPTKKSTVFTRILSLDSAQSSFSSDSESSFSSSEPTKSDTQSSFSSSEPINFSGPSYHCITLLRRGCVPFYKNNSGFGYHYYTPSGTKKPVNTNQITTFCLRSEDDIDWTGTLNASKDMAKCDGPHGCTVCTALSANPTNLFYNV